MTDKITKFRPQTKNVNKHTAYGLRLLEKSLREDGFIDAQTAAADGEIISGSARLEKAVEIFTDKDGVEVEPIIVHSDGTRPVIVIRDDIPNAESARAKRLSVAANKIAQVDFDPDWGLLKDWGAEDAGIKALFSDKEWQEGTGEDISGVEKGKKPNPRILPIDVIFTMENYLSQWTPMAYYSGLKWGIQSNSKVLSENYKPHYIVTFVDNVYTEYKHENHLEVVKRFKPKYCTVRDIMTEEQCKVAGIAYYSFEQIMTWAEELAQYCPNVIVIPKYDCIKDVSKKFMLGYSIPTSHGGTPLPVDLFRGRRIHLLGGSWAAQLDYLAELGEDVVSIDNNHCHRIAEFGQYYLPDGKTKTVSDINGTMYPNGATIALALSFGAIASKVNELYGGNGQPAEETKQE